jgi:hypothetical protein
MVEQIVGVMHALWHDNWGPRLDDILRAALLTLMAEPGMTLVEVPLILTDAAFRRRLLAKVDDFVLQGFWAQYEGWSDGERSQAIAPVLNKLRAFLLRRRIRNMVGQAAPRFNFETALSRGQVVLVPLAKGLLGEGAAGLLGALVLAQLWQAALGRTRQSASGRPLVAVYVDEVQDYLGLPTSVADMLAQGRGLGIGVTIAHQHLGQLPRSIQQAVLANAASRVVFRTGADDARVLARDLPPLNASDLQELDAFEVVARLATDTGIAPPATAVTLPLGRRFSDPARIREHSRRSFGVETREVEADMQQRQQARPDGPVGRRRS